MLIQNTPGKETSKIRTSHASRLFEMTLQKKKKKIKTTAFYVILLKWPNK